LAFLPVEVYTRALKLASLINCLWTHLGIWRKMHISQRELSELLFQRTVRYSGSFRASHLRFVVSPMTEKASLVVIVGRPNVGKSQFSNRLTGTRRSIVTDEPGHHARPHLRHRDLAGAHVRSRRHGRIVPDDKAAIPREILRQAQVAIEKRVTASADRRCPRGPHAARLRVGEPASPHGQTSGNFWPTKSDTQMQESLRRRFYELFERRVFDFQRSNG